MGFGRDLAGAARGLLNMVGSGQKVDPAPLGQAVLELRRKLGIWDQHGNPETLDHAEQRQEYLAAMDRFLEVSGRIEAGAFRPELGLEAAQLRSALSVHAERCTSEWVGPPR